MTEHATMTIEQANEKRDLLTRVAVRKLIRLRNEHLNEIDFGNAVAPLIDSLIFDLSVLPIQQHGKWTTDEEGVLETAFRCSSGVSNAIKNAANKLHRTESQIHSKARNMGLC